MQHTETVGVPHAEVFQGEHEWFDDDENNSSCVHASAKVPLICRLISIAEVFLGSHAAFQMLPLCTQGFGLPCQI